MAFANQWLCDVTDLLGDLHVNDVGLIDGLIEDEYLTIDDWNHINHLARNKKKIKELVRLLVKNSGNTSNAKMAFNCLIRQMDRNHKHMVQPLQKFLKQYPIELLRVGETGPKSVEHDEREENGFQTGPCLGPDDNEMRRSLTATKEDRDDCNNAKDNSIMESAIKGLPPPNSSVYSDESYLDMHHVKPCKCKEFGKYTTDNESSACGNILNLERDANHNTIGTFGIGNPYSTDGFDDVDGLIGFDYQQVAPATENLCSDCTSHSSEYQHSVEGDSQSSEDVYESRLLNQSRFTRQTVDKVTFNSDIPAHSMCDCVREQYAKNICEEAKISYCQRPGVRISSKVEGSLHQSARERSATIGVMSNKTQSQIKEIKIVTTTDEETNTDVHTSDLDTDEASLSRCLNGVVPDIMDDLIGDGTLSDDDWNAIHKIPIQSRKAAYLARRLSDSDFQENNMTSLRRVLVKRFPSLLHPFDAVVPSEKVRAAFEVNMLDTRRPMEHTDSESNDCDFDNMDQPESEVGNAIQMFRGASDQETVISRLVMDIPHMERDSMPKCLLQFQDCLVELFNKGDMSLKGIPDVPDYYVIAFYMKACEFLNMEQCSDAKKYIKLAKISLKKSTYHVQLRSELLTAETWYALQSKKMGKMHSLLTENEQFLIAHPTLWTEKGIGWFYYDYGRFYNEMLDRRMKTSENMCQKAIGCFQKAIDHFRRDTSSDGPVGECFCLCSLASALLNSSQHTIRYWAEPIGSIAIEKSKRCLECIRCIYKDNIPVLVEPSYLSSLTDLCYRQGKMADALAYCLRTKELCRTLKLTVECASAERREAIVRQALDVQQIRPQEILHQETEQNSMLTRNHVKMLAYDCSSDSC